MTQIVCDHCGKTLDTMHDYDNISIETLDEFHEADLCADCRNELGVEMDSFVRKFLKRED